VDDRGEAQLAAALAPFGWRCDADREFWRRYYTDPWVFNLANAVERLTLQLEEAERKLARLQTPAI
jgi:hypothetical protein